MNPSDESLARALLDEVRTQWSQCHHKLRHCADQLIDEQLWQRDAEELNSVANLLLHLTGNIRQRMLSVVDGQPDLRDRDAEFAARGPAPKSAILAALEDVMRQTDELLAGLPAERLLETRRYRMLRGEVEHTVVGVMLQTLSHVAGHTQEVIALTRRLLGPRYRFLQAAGRR